MPYYGPDEDSDTIFLERTFLAGDFINGMTLGENLRWAEERSSLLLFWNLLGIVICMYASCMQVLWQQRRARKFSTFLMIYLTLLFIVLLIFVSVSAGTVQFIYIDNRNYPGGPWSFFLATQNLPINVIFIATFFILTLLADALIVRRSFTSSYSSNLTRLLSVRSSGDAGLFGLRLVGRQRSLAHFSRRYSWQHHLVTSTCRS